MAYIPTNWQTGDIVTAEKLNHLEEGHLPEFDLFDLVNPIASSISVQAVEQPSDAALAGPFNFSIPAGEYEYTQEIELNTELQAGNTYFISLNGVLHKATTEGNNSMIIVRYSEYPITVVFVSGPSGLLIPNSNSDDPAALFSIQSEEDSAFEGSVTLYPAAQYDLGWKIDPYPEYDIVIGCETYVTGAVSQSFYFIKDNGFLNMKIDEGIPVRGALFSFPTSNNQCCLSMIDISRISGTEDEYSATFSSPYFYSETAVKLQLVSIAFKFTGLSESNIIKNVLVKTVDIGTTENESGNGNGSIK